MHAHKLQSAYVEIWLWMFQYVWQFIFCPSLPFLSHVVSTNKNNFESHSMSWLSYNFFILFLLATCSSFYPQDGLFQVAGLLSSFVS